MSIHKKRNTRPLLVLMKLGKNDIPSGKTKSNTAKVEKGSKYSESNNTCFMFGNSSSLEIRPL